MSEVSNMSAYYVGFAARDGMVDGVLSLEASSPQAAVAEIRERCRHRQDSVEVFPVAGREVPDTVVDPMYIAGAVLVALREGRNLDPNLIHDVLATSVGISYREDAEDAAWVVHEPSEELPGIVNGKVVEVWGPGQEA